MKNLLLCLIVVCTASMWATAQDTSTAPKGKAETRTITGCLAKGEDANEFLLTGQDGSTWEIKSKSVPLAEHVGHTISATGVVANSTAHNMKEDTKDMAHDTGMTKTNTEHGHFKVTDVKMVSDSCSK